MIPWSERSPEEQALIGPSFLSVLLWHAAEGHKSAFGMGMPFAEAFLVAPLVLHRETRGLLPRTTRTSLPVWLDDQRVIKSRVAERAEALAPYTREALIFAGSHGLVAFDKDTICATRHWRTAINTNLGASSEEVRDCASRATFVGKWFASAGGVTTVLALMGVRP